MADGSGIGRSESERKERRAAPVLLRFPYIRHERDVAADRWDRIGGERAGDRYEDAGGTFPDVGGVGRMNSLLQEEKECFICGKTTGLHKHHIYGRRQPEEKRRERLLGVAGARVAQHVRQRGTLRQDAGSYIKAALSEGVRERAHAGRSS